MKVQSFFFALPLQSTSFAGQGIFNKETSLHYFLF
jgi:hypothetical protein